MLHASSHLLHPLQAAKSLDIQIGLTNLFTRISHQNMLLDVIKICAILGKNYEMHKNAYRFIWIA